MGQLKDLNLGFFMSAGMSLDKWQRKAGLLSREIAPYNLLAKYLKKIYIFTYGQRETEQKYRNLLAENIELVYRRYKWRNNEWSAYLLPLLNWRIIRQCQILKTNQMSGAEALILSRLINPRARLAARTGYIWSLNAREIRSDTKQLERRIYRLADVALVSTAAAAEYIEDEYELPPGKVKVLAGYIDTDLFKPLPNKKFDNRVLSVARLSEEKNLDSLILALKGTGIGLDIIGTGQMQSKLVAIAKQISVDLRLLGVLSNQELPALINQYNVFALPSLYEGLPKALLEAMSCGIACVTTDVPGCSDVVTDKENGLLCDVTAASLRAAVVTLFKDHKLRKSLGIKARQHVISNYSLAGQVKKELQIYEQFI